MKNVIDLSNYINEWDYEFITPSGFKFVFNKMTYYGGLYKILSQKEMDAMKNFPMEEGPAEITKASMEVKADRELTTGLLKESLDSLYKKTGVDEKGEATYEEIPIEYNSKDRDEAGADFNGLPTFGIDSLKMELENQTEEYKGHVLHS